MPISFNNPLKACFSNKKNLTIIQTRPTQILKAYFLFKNRFLMIIGTQNQLPFTFCSDLVWNKTLEARNLTPTHEFLAFDILIEH